MSKQDPYGGLSYIPPTHEKHWQRAVDGDLSHPSRLTFTSDQGALVYGFDPTTSQDTWVFITPDGHVVPLETLLASIS